MKIKHISDKEALDFLRKNKANHEVVFIRSCDRWFGAFIDGELVGTTGLCDGRNHIKISGSFVVPYHRKKGIMTALTNHVLSITKGHKIVTYARPGMAKINKKFGFKTVQVLKNKTEKQVYENE